MTVKEIIDGLKFTVDMFLFDPTTGETYTEPRNDMDKTTIDACKGAIELLEQTRWIPLNAEGNEPKEEGFYLLCLSDGYVTNVYYDGKDWELWLNAGEPIAWQPLPQRYEVESEDAE